MTNEQYQIEENMKKWNIVATIVFAVLVFFIIQYLKKNSSIPSSLSFFDFAVITLAVFRLSRLISYDNVFLFLRESFLDVKRVSYAEGGEEHLERVPSVNSLKRIFGMLFGCPWCIGLWLSLFTFFLYFACPSLRIFFMIIAIAGAASLLQIFTNLIGWSAERKKQEAENTDTI